jgi:hypothetical protein
MIWYLQKSVLGSGHDWVVLAMQSAMQRAIGQAKGSEMRTVRLVMSLQQRSAASCVVAGPGPSSSVVV